MQGAHCTLTVAPAGTPNTTFSKGLLRYKGKLIIGSTTDLREKIISSLYNKELGGHSGERPRIKEPNFYFIGLA
jgi:hypothetical protein